MMKKRPALLVLSALVAAAFALPASAGTDKQSSSSGASYDQTESPNRANTPEKGSNADSSRDANTGSSSDSSSTVTTPPDTTTAPSDTTTTPTPSSDASSGSSTQTSKYPRHRGPNLNGAAVGGQSSGKYSNSPGQ